MSSWKSNSHCKYLLQYHLIFVCKYRKSLLENKVISDEIKQLSAEISKKHNVSIRYMETDKNHIHYMIETTPNINLSNFIRTLKAIHLITYGNHIKKSYQSIYITDIVSGQVDISSVP